MSSTPNRHYLGFGLGVGLIGLVMISLGINMADTNLDTFVDPRIWSAVIVVIGATALTVGVGLMLLSIMRSPSRP
jgi:flagellar motor component MotA